MMSKLIVSFLILFSFQFGYSQSNTPPVFFAQCLVELSSPEQAEQLATSMREIAYVKTVRVDWITKRVFLITKNTDEFTKVSFISWLGEYSNSASCVQIGLHGVDLVQPYPFVNCND